MSPLPVWFKGLTPELIKKAELEVKETPEIKAKGLTNIKNLINEQDDLYSRMDDVFLLRFLRTKKFDVKKAYKVLYNYYNFKTKHAGVFTKRKPSEIKKVLDMNNIIFSPYRVDGSHLVIIRIGGYNPQMATGEEFIATLFVCAELILDCEASQICGGILIVDLLGASLHQYKMFITFQFAKFLTYALQECWPERLKGVHFVNEPYILHVVYQMVKPFGKKKLFERWRFHGKNMSSLHEFVPRNLLPEELGGTLGPINNKEFADYILSQEEYIVETNKYGILE